MAHSRALSRAMEATETSALSRVTSLDSGSAAGAPSSAAHHHEAVARPRNATADQNQVVFGQDLDHALAQDRTGLVAVLTRHLATREHATRSHVGTDRATVPLV